MVKIVDVVYENGIVTLRYTPEQSGEYGVLVYDVKNDKWLKKQKTNFDKKITIYVSGILGWILGTIESGKPFPKEYLLMMF